MDIYLLAAFFSLGVLLPIASSQSCEQSYYERCLRQLVDFADRGDLLFAFSSQQLQHECVQAQSALGCLTRYAKKCLPPEERTQFTDGIAGPSKITLGLCTDETDFKSRYVASLPCLKNMSEGLQYCKEKYDRNQKDIILVEYEEKTHLQCCSFDGYRRCLRMLLETQNECRESAASVVDEIAIRLGGVYTEDVCTEYFEKCTGGYSLSKRTAASRYLVLVASLLLMCLVKYVVWI